MSSSLRKLAGILAIVLAVSVFSGWLDSWPFVQLLTEQLWLLVITVVGGLITLAIWPLCKPFFYLLRDKILDAPVKRPEQEAEFDEAEEREFKEDQEIEFDEGEEEDIHEDHELDFDGRIFTSRTTGELLDAARKSTSIHTQLHVYPEIGKWIRVQNAIVDISLPAGYGSIEVKFNRLGLWDVSLFFDRKKWGAELESMDAGDRLAAIGKISSVSSTRMQLSDCEIVQLQEENDWVPFCL